MPVAHYRNVIDYCDYGNFLAVENDLRSMVEDVETAFGDYWFRKIARAFEEGAFVDREEPSICEKCGFELIPIREKSVTAYDVIDTLRLFDWLGISKGRTGHVGYAFRCLKCGNAQHSEYRDWVWQSFFAVRRQLSLNAVVLCAITASRRFSGKNVTIRNLEVWNILGALRLQAVNNLRIYRGTPRDGVIEIINEQGCDRLAEDIAYLHNFASLCSPVEVRTVAYPDGKCKKCGSTKMERSCGGARFQFSLSTVEFLLFWHLTCRFAREGSRAGVLMREHFFFENSMKPFDGVENLLALGEDEHGMFVVQQFSLPVDVSSFGCKCRNNVDVVVRDRGSNKGYDLKLEVECEECRVNASFKLVHVEKALKKLFRRMGYGAPGLADETLTPCLSNMEAIEFTEKGMVVRMAWEEGLGKYIGLILSTLNVSRETAYAVMDAASRVSRGDWESPEENSS